MIPRLFAISPGDGRDLAPWLAVLGAAGVRGVILRERPDADLRRAVAAARDARFTAVFAHARHPDAARCGADGVHLPDDGRPPVTPVWGRSTHSPSEARAAVDAGAALALLSPIWPPTSKPGDRRDALGIAGLLAAGPGPILALGGVTPARWRELRDAGAYGAAVLGTFAAHPAAAAEYCP